MRYMRRKTYPKELLALWYVVIIAAKFVCLVLSYFVYVVFSLFLRFELLCGSSRRGPCVPRSL